MDPLIWRQSLDLKAACQRSGPLNEQPFFAQPLASNAILSYQSLRTTSPSANNKPSLRTSSIPIKTTYFSIRLNQVKEQPSFLKTLLI
eukprot:1612089-Amphidinium_carterae.1